MTIIDGVNINELSDLFFSQYYIVGKIIKYLYIVDKEVDINSIKNYTKYNSDLENILSYGSSFFSRYGKLWIKNNNNNMYIINPNIKNYIKKIL
jgi:hypothetical protein